MIEEFEFKGKTTDEAMAKAREELGDRIDEMEFSIVEMPSAGFLGIGAKPAVIKYTATVAEGTGKALEFIKLIIKDLELDVEASESKNDEGAALIEINGKDAGVLIGHHGDTLDAIQYLANLTANHRREDDDRDYTKIVVDIEGYRAKREETLRALARRVAEKVQKYNRSVALEPMNPGERRIIHSEIQDIPGVCTTSVGSDENRKVIVYPEGTSPTSDKPHNRGGRRGGYRPRNSSSKGDK